MAEAKSDIESLNATIVHREDVSPGLAIIHVAPDEGEIMPFKPGQFCNLGLLRLDDKGEPIIVHNRIKRVRRAYSIASSADERRYVEIYLTRVEGGQLTPRVFSLDVGEKVFLDPKIQGKFTLDNVPENKDLILVGTGTGLAPYVSMLRTYRDRGESPWRRCVVVHGARHVSDLGYYSELQAIAAEDDDITYIPIVSREPVDSNWDGMRGRVQAVFHESTFEGLTGFMLTPDACQIMLCGNPVMITSMEQALHNRGFVTHSKQTPGQIHFERYW